MRSGALYPCPTLAGHIDVRACSFWPTATDADSRSSARHTTTTGASHTGTMLSDAIQLWRTPDSQNAGGVRTRQTSRGQGHQKTIAEQAEHWPTPSARDHKGENSVDHVTINGTGRMHLDQLPNFVAHLFRPDLPTSSSGNASSTNDPTSRPLSRLNPNFVEWLMGLPDGWTDIDRIDSGPVATPLFLYKRHMRSWLWRLVLA
jgi:hypothetical protein